MNYLIIYIIAFFYTSDIFCILFFIHSIYNALTHFGCLIIFVLLRDPPFCEHEYDDLFCGTVERYSAAADAVQLAGTGRRDRVLTICRPSSN